MGRRAPCPPAAARPRPRRSPCPWRPSAVRHSPRLLSALALAHVEPQRDTLVPLALESAPEPEAVANRRPRLHAPVAAGPPFGSGRRAGLRRRPQPRSVDTGFARRGTVIPSLPPLGEAYAEAPAAAHRLFAQLCVRVEALPGVTAAAGGRLRPRETRGTERLPFPQRPRRHPAATSTRSDPGAERAPLHPRRGPRSARLEIASRSRQSRPPDSSPGGRKLDGRSSPWRSKSFSHQVFYTGSVLALNVSRRGVTA
jgi:hypothetical protein